MGSSYVLATTGVKVQWYKFTFGKDLKRDDFELVNELDLMVVPIFGDKATALKAANALGLKTWRYVRL